MYLCFSSSTSQRNIDHAQSEYYTMTIVILFVIETNRRKKLNIYPFEKITWKIYQNTLLIEIKQIACQTYTVPNCFKIYIKYTRNIQEENTQN